MRNSLGILFIVILWQANGAHADINETTDRFVRNHYGCMISTVDAIKPEFSERESAWASWMTGLADLNSDGAPEVIAGYEHEYAPQGGRFSRNVYQYGFYSTDPAFEHPSGTRFLAARTMLTQDFNNDGKDDVVFVQSGPDYAPYVPARNEILLSTENGYQSRYLSSDRSLFHGGAAGDFDGDGDVDIVTTPGAKSEITILLNDGAGRFTPTKRLRGFGRNYNVKAWDIDRDGKLDLLFDGHEEPLTVLWGEGNGDFKRKTVVESLNNSNLLQDAVFLDADDGGTDIVIVSSLSINEPLPYQGFSVDLISFEGRKIAKSSSIDKVETPEVNTRVWLNFIHACDLGSDGDIDIVFESFGSNDRFVQARADWLFLDKIVWENRDNSFQRQVILNSNYRLVPNGVFPENFFGEAEIAERMGISIKRYLPNQTYAQVDVKETFMRRHQKLINSLLRDTTTIPKQNATSSSTWNTGAEMSDRARCILAKSRGQIVDCESENLETTSTETSANETGSDWNSGAELSDRAKRILDQREKAADKD